MELSEGVAAVTETNIVKNRKTRELVIERAIDAPVDLVWQGWTRREHIANWWGPSAWTTTIYEMDVRPQGTWRYSLHADADPTNKTWCKAVYHDVVEASRLVYTDSFTDRNGNVEPDTEMPTTVTFSSDGKKTNVVVRTQFTSISALDAAERNGMIDGYVETLDRLESHVERYKREQ